MARYFFHLRDGQDVLLDPDGIDLPDPVTIVAKALAAARSILSADALEGRLQLDLRIDVEDEGGSLVHRLAFADAIAIVPADA
jgi:hypothetical protein